MSKLHSKEKMQNGVRSKPRTKKSPPYTESSKRISSSQAALAKAPLSAEYIVDSSDNESSSERLSQTQTKVKTKSASSSSGKSLTGNIAKPAAAVSGAYISSETSESEKDNLTSSAHRKKSIQAVAGLQNGWRSSEVPTRATTSMASPSGQEQDSSSDDTEEDQSEISGDPIDSRAGKTHKRAKSMHEIEMRPSKVYKPPPGYKDASDQEPWHERELFDASRLNGQQVWLISAPAQLSLENIQSLSAEQLRGEEPLKYHDGLAYNVQVETQASAPNSSIMTPHNKLYTQLPLAFNRVFNVRQSVNIPTSSHTIMPEAAQLPAKRMQPAGLRTRWHPPGSRDSLASAQEGLIPSEGGETHREKKRKQDADDEASSRKKKQKNKNKDKNTLDHTVEQDRSTNTAPKPVNGTQPASQDPVNGFRRNGEVGKGNKDKKRWVSEVINNGSAQSSGVSKERIGIEVEDTNPKKIKMSKKMK